MPGRTPKPTRLKILQGNPGERRLNPNEPQPEIISIVPAAPAHLTEVAKEKWRDAAAELCRLKLLTKADIDLLANYCICYARKRDADKFIRDHGLSYPIKAEDGRIKCLQQFPHVNISRDMAVLMMQIGDRLGMSPSSRSRISVPEWNPSDEEVAAKRLLG